MIPFVVFVTVSAGCMGLLQVASRYADPSRRRTLRRLTGRQDLAGDETARLYRDLGVLDGDLAFTDGTPAPKVGTGAVSLRDRAEDALRYAGVPLTVKQFVLLLALLAGAGAALGAWFGGPVGGGFGVTIGTGVPLLVVDARRKARRDRLLKQLVGAFELMARVLRSGQTVPEAFRGTVEAFDEPLAGEFSPCVHQMDLGLRQDVALQSLIHRSSVLEIRLFVTAMTIHRQAGGNLSEVLDRLASLVRTRLHTRQKLRALTAEGRLQSVSLVFLPVVTFAAMFALNRPYAEQLFEYPRLIAATGGLMAVGVVWIRRVVNFEG